MLFAMTLLVILAGQFAQALALLHSSQIAVGLQAELLRYSLVLLMFVSISYQVANDYELQFFSLLLSMPIARYQYILAQSILVLFLSAFLALPILPIIGFESTDKAIYWYLAVVLELILVGQIALLMSISLEKFTVAFMSGMAFYLFCKTLPLITMALRETAEFYEGDQAIEFFQWFFSGMQYLLPGYSAFAQNDLLFNQLDVGVALQSQIKAVFVYLIFLHGVLLIDYYRKDFNET